MSSRYVPISLAQFTALMDEMKFRPVTVDGCFEHVFEHVISYPKGGVPENRFVIRIYSTVDMGTGWTREVGDDAIRVCLLDTQNRDERDRDRGERSFTRVHRTQGALENLRLRAKEAWKAVASHGALCDKCGSLMVERKTKRNGKTERFLGCSGYRRDDPQSCRRTRPLECKAA